MWPRCCLAVRPFIWSKSLNFQAFRASRKPLHHWVASFTTTFYPSATSKFMQFLFAWNITIDRRAADINLAQALHRKWIYNWMCWTKKKKNCFRLVCEQFNIYLRQPMLSLSMPQRTEEQNSSSLLSTSCIEDYDLRADEKWQDCARKKKANERTNISTANVFMILCAVAVAIRNVRWLYHSDCTRTRIRCTQSDVYIDWRSRSYLPK